MELFFLKHGEAISLLMMIAGIALIGLVIALRRRDKKHEDG